jgi:hypothetical protein
MAGLQGRVSHAAEDILARQGSVTFAEVLVGIGWLAGVHVDLWRQGRVTHLQELVQVRPERIREALQLLQGWSQERGLGIREVVPLARSRRRTELRFGPVDGPGADPQLEQAIRVCWVRAELPDRDADRVVAQRSKAPDLLVIQPLHQDWTCHESGGSGDLLMMEGPGPICLTCADLDHLAFLPAGDATLTRRAKKASMLSAVVVRFSRTRKRYERQGILVEQRPLTPLSSPAWPTSRSAPTAGNARTNAGPVTTSSSSSSGRPAFCACSPAAHPAGPRLSPPGPQPGAAGGSAARPRAVTWNRRRSNAPWPPPSATRTPTTTSCS